MSRKRKKKNRKKKRIISPPLKVEKPQGESSPKHSKGKKKYLFFLLPGCLILLLALIFLILGSSRTSISKNRDLNVLLVTLDTTRSDRIGCYGYQRAETPNIDWIASKGVRFENAYCQVPLTLPSHCSIFTGTYPIYHRVRNNGFYYLGTEHLTLSEILKEKGFKTAAFVSSFTVDSRFGLDQGFDYYDDDFLEKGIAKNFTSERKAEDVFRAFSNWFDKNHSQKFFIWVHFYDPHLPYNPPSPFKEKYSERPYDGEIAYMDVYVGKIVEKLREKNLLERTLIILAGDHGEALGEKDEVDHGLFIYDVSMRVPFIIFSPSHLPQKRVIRSRVRLIDIMPTVLDMLEISESPEIQGQSLLPFISKKKKKDLPSYIETYMPREYYAWSELVGFIDGEWKYIKAPKPELYNLKSDPGENNNLFQRERKISSRLEEGLQRLLEKYSSEKEGKRKLTPEEEARLRSLGYLSTDLSGELKGKKLPDPKDKIQEYAIYAHARKYEYEKDYERAERNYLELIRLNPDSPWNYVNLALLYEKMGRLEDSIRIMEKGRKMLPDSIVILSRLSLFYMKEAKPKEAFETSQAVLEIDPKYFDALYISGVALVNTGNWKEALEYFEKALEIEPENKPLRLQYAYCLTVVDRAQDALKIYLKLREEYPEDPVIYRELGILYDTLGEIEKAKQNLRKAVELNPSPNAYYNYAVVLEKSGDLKQAVYYLKLFLEMTPEKKTTRFEEAKMALLQWEKRLSQGESK